VRSAAQRAFFDAALGKVQPVAAPRPAAAPASAQPVRTVAKAAPAEAPETDNYPRPGSRLDITV
jgi:hypothetical protein